MKHPILGLAIILVCIEFSAYCIHAGEAHSDGLADQLQEILRNRIEAGGVPPRIVIGEDIIYSSSMLPRFYEEKAYTPAWNGKTGPLTERASSLIEVIREADQHGLRAENYHLNKIEELLSAVFADIEKKVSPNPHRLVDLDLLLTDAFLVYGAHLWAGSINPETIDPEWHAARKGIDLSEILQNALDTNQIETALRELIPPQPGYRKLQEVLTQYRDVAGRGGWPSIPQGPALRKADRSSRVSTLRRRLIFSGDMDPYSQDDEDYFDEILEGAVRRFQHRHGLEPDGIAGPATLAALNVPVDERIQQIEVNMERWRWLPQDLGHRYILVNIANFELDYVEEGKLLLNMRVIVGRQYRRTPVFTGDMSYLVVNPYWNIPPLMARRDILPAIQKDPDYLDKMKIRVFKGWGGEDSEIDHRTIDWNKVSVKNIIYRFRQDPGPDNALGKIKFMFPNKFNVYLHDTPDHGLFGNSVRTFSSGCIRLEKPFELAEHILRNDPRWTNGNIQASIESGEENTVWLSSPVPVHILYWTTWMAEDGTINFRNDIYRRDARLKEALAEKPPRGR